MPFADTIAAIREQGGLVYLPHPFDRMHTIPDPATLHRHLADIDVFEVYNARLLFETHQRRGAAIRAQVRPDQGAGSDAHVLQGVGTGAVRMRAIRRPGGVPDLAAQRRDPAPAEVARLPAEPEVDGPGQGKGPLGEKVTPSSVPASVPTDEIYERYLEEGDHRDQRLGDELARAGDEPRAGRRPRPSARRRLPAQVRAAAAGDPGGRRVLRRARGTRSSSRSAAARRPDRGLRDELRQVRQARTADVAAWLARELRIVQPKLVVVMGERRARLRERARVPALATGSRLRSASSSASRPRSRRSSTPDIDDVARRAAREDRVLERLQGARPLVGRAAALLSGRRAARSLARWHALVAYAPARGSARLPSGIDVVFDRARRPARRSPRVWLALPARRGARP